MVTPCLDYLELSGSWILAKYQAHKVLFLSFFTFLKIKPELRNLKQNLVTNILILCPRLRKKSVFLGSKKCFMQQSFLLLEFSLNAAVYLVISRFLLV